MKNDEFHVPFIHSLIIIACVTVCAMSFAHFYVPKFYDSYKNSQQYTSYKSYNEAKAGE